MKKANHISIDEINEHFKLGEKALDRFEFENKMFPMKKYTKVIQELDGKDETIELLINNDLKGDIL